MATKKITVTVAEAELARIHELVGEGHARSVSGFVQQAITHSLDAEVLWAEYLADALEKSGGPPTPEEIAWADGVLAAADAWVPPCEG